MAMVVLISVAGCGGSSSSNNTPQGAANAFLNAFANGDGGAACALLTSHEQGVLASSGGSVKSGSCPATIAFVAMLANPSTVAKLKHVVAAFKTTINGKTATIKGKAGSPMTLTKTNGHWLISGGVTS